MSWIVRKLREARVVGRQLVGREPVVRVRGGVPLEYHGGPAGGWSIASGLLNRHSAVVDVGLGEDLSFPHSIIERYGCTVHGFDPTPRAVAYARRHSRPELRVFELGLGPQDGSAELFLPINADFVSGSIQRGSHLRGDGVPISVVSMDGLFERIAADHIDLLKLDIEGAEFDVIASDAFARHAGQIRQLCVEFHHRWHERGRQITEDAVRTLAGLGFECIWHDPTTNEEFTFLRVGER
jgi:FkbM family methyltransferase